jgi:hypothetical protein
MPSQRTVTVYKFTELAPKVQQKLIDREIKYLHENFDADYLTDFFKERLEKAGLPHEDVQWSLSSSQGDGVAFYGRFNLRDYIKENNLALQYSDLTPGVLMDVSAEIVRKGSHRYNHSNSMQLEIIPGGELTKAEESSLKSLDDHIASHINHIASHIKDVSRELEKLGYSDIEDSTSEERAREQLENNDLEYDEKGHVI